MPSLDSQEFAGEYVDRNGQTKKICVSKDALAPKELQTVWQIEQPRARASAGLSARQVVTKEKVSDAIPDAERDKDEDRKAWRRTTKELNHRMLYFNHTHNTCGHGQSAFCRV